jgi:hypothetical protein
MSYHGEWHEDSLGALWGRQKTARLVREGLLQSHGTDALGRQLFDDRDVMRHYQFKSPEAPGRGCCTCCRHGCEPTYESAAALATTKAFGGPGYEDEYEPDEYEEEYEPDIEDRYTPQEYLEGDFPPDEDEGEDGGGLDEPEGGGELDEDADDDEDDGEPMEDYIDRRIAAIDAEEKMAAALDRQADLMALEQSLFGLAVGRLGVKVAAARMLRG